MFRVIVNFQSYFILLFLIFTFSCEKECPDGYSGRNCEIENRSKFIGIWKSTDYECKGDTIGIDFRIVRGENISNIVWDLSSSIGLSYDLELDGIVVGDSIQADTLERSDTRHSGKLKILEEGFLEFETVTIISSMPNVCKGTAFIQ